MNKIVALICFMFFVINVDAQPPQAFKYQAIARNASGQLIANEPVNLQVSILKGSTDGVSLYIESFQVTTNNYGLINIEIGKGSVVSGNLQEIDWGADSYFLKTWIDGNEMGVTQLLSVPYALYAAEAGNTFSGSYSGLSDIPEDLADGDDDTQLTEAQVDAFTDNNGYITEESDPVFSVSPAANITGAAIEGWNNKLEDYSETDPQFSESVSAGITGMDTARWNQKSDFSGNFDDLKNVPDSRTYMEISLTGDTLYLADGNFVVIPGISAANPQWGGQVAPMNYGRSDLGCVTIDHQIYAVGGTDGSNHFNYVEVYDPHKNQWKVKSPLQIGRSKHGIASYGGKILVFGGYQQSGGMTNTVEQYDPATDTWTFLESMPVATRGMSVGVVNDTIYVMGGQTDGNVHMAYFPKDNSWEFRTILPGNRSYLSGTVVLNEQIYLIGGNSYDPTQFHTTTFIYDAGSKTWLAGGPLNVGRSFHGVALLNNKVYALGGATYGWTGIASVEEYDPVMNSWTSLANMPFATWAYGITTLDGKIYIVGGDNGSQRLKTVQVFRP